MDGIIQISEAASLAFHSMIIIANSKEEPCSVKDIAHNINASEAHLSKVLQRLTKEGLLRSIRGPKGGYLLAKEAKDITLLDVYQAIEGPLSVESCLLGRDVCLFEECLFGDFFDKVSKDFKDYLSLHRLSELS